MSGSTAMSGSASLFTMSALPRGGTSATGHSARAEPAAGRRGRPRAPPGETNATEVAPGARPSAPHIGRGRTGCGVGIDAFASPIGAQAIKPPLITTCGRTPKNAGSPQHEVGELARLDRADLARRGRARWPGRSCTWRRSAGRGRCRAAPSPGSAPAALLHHVRGLPGAASRPRRSRPIAWESDPIIEIAPRSCRMSSAAIVDGRMRLSANARSSGTRRVEVVADHEHVEVLVERVDACAGGSGWSSDGSTFGSPRDGDDVGRVAAARAFGVVGVDRPAGDRGEGVVDEARLVQRVGVDAPPARRPPRQTRRQASIAAGVDPQSSCSLNPAAPPRSCSPQRLPRRRCCPCPSSTTFTGQASVASSIRARCHAPGRDRGRLGALGRAGAAADERRHPAAERLGDELRADEVDVAVDAARGQDQPVAGDDLGATARSPGPGARRP